MVIDQTWSLEKVLAKTKRKTLFAEPLLGNIDSPWIALPKGTIKKLKEVVGRAAYSAHEGAGFTPRGIFIAEVLSKDKNYVTLRNLSGWRGAKMKIEKEIIKKVRKEVVYQLFFGREIDRWIVSRKRKHFAIILYHSSTGKMLSENFAKVNFPNAYSYYNHFKEMLMKAANYKQYGKGKPCYFIHRMGRQIFSPFKVVWREVGTQINAAVVTKALASNKQLPIPDYTCVYIPLYHKEEAYYVSGVLNSTLSRMVTSYIHLHPDPHVLDYVKIKKYDKENTLHKRIVKLSINAHRTAAKKDEYELSKIEKKIDLLVAKLYGMSRKELESLEK